MKDSIERWLGTLFGLIFVALSCLVAVETFVRKAFNFSLQGADELGGYALAFGATIAFSLALMGRSHIRVDVFHDRLPAVLQTALNWLSVVCLAAFAGAAGLAGLVRDPGYARLHERLADALGDTAAVPAICLAGRLDHVCAGCGGLCTQSHLAAGAWRCRDAEP